MGKQLIVNNSQHTFFIMNYPFIFFSVSLEYIHTYSENFVLNYFKYWGFIRDFHGISKGHGINHVIQAFSVPIYDIHLYFILLSYLAKISRNVVNS